MKIGSTDIADVKIGSTDIQKVYAGTSLIWERAAASTPVSAAYLETESGTIGAQWTITSDATASGGQYIVRPSGAILEPMETAEYHAVYEVNLEAGTYVLHCLLDSPAGDSNSSHFRINANAWVTHTDGSFGTGWHWRTIMGGVNSVTLPAGIATIYISSREAGQKLDKLYITKNGDEPV